MHTILIGDAREQLATIPAGTVQTCVTSPPYYGLRDYNVDGQIGLEQTVDAYVQALVDVFREVRRVLRDDGTLWLNLGDSYNSGPSEGSRPGSGRADGIVDDRAQRNRNGTHAPGLKPKDLIGVPWRVAFALQADGWYLRSEIIWHKPNPMPESVTDRPTKAHETVFLLSKSPRYFYDAAAIAEPAESAMELWRIKNGDLESQGAKSESLRASSIEGATRKGFNPTGVRNKRSVWTIATKPYSGAHFAVFPPELARTCILAGSREGDTVLDPFAGSGTSGEVAVHHGRRAILCELNPDYVPLIEQRLAQRTIWHAMDGREAS